MLVIHPHTACVCAVAYSPDGRLLASVSDDGSLKAWDPAQLAGGDPLWEVLDAHYSGGSHAQFTPDGRLLLTCGDDATLKAWDPADSGRLRWQRKWPGHYSLHGIMCLVISRDGRFVAWAGGYLHQPEPVLVHRVSTRKLHKRLPGHRQAVGILAAGPDGFATGSADRRIRFWDWDTGKRYHELTLRGYVRTLAISPDGNRMAGSAGSDILLWDMTAGKGGRRVPGRAARLRGHTRRAAAIDFSPDGGTLVSTSEDGTLRLWDVASGTERRAIAPGLGQLHWCAFAPDGLTVAFSSARGHVGVLDVGD